MKIGETAEVTFAFEQPTTTFSLTQIDYQHGTFGALTEVAGSDKTHWKAEFTPDADVQNLVASLNMYLR